MIFESNFVDIPNFVPNFDHWLFIGCFQPLRLLPRVACCSQQETSGVAVWTVIFKEINSVQHSLCFVSRGSIEKVPLVNATAFQNQELLAARRENALKQVEARVKPWICPKCNYNNSPNQGTCAMCVFSWKSADEGIFIICATLLKRFPFDGF